MLQFANLAKRLVFRRFADTARIDQNDIGLFHVFRRTVAQFFKLAGIMLRIALVHLAAIGQYKIKTISRNIHVVYLSNSKKILLEFSVYNTINASH